MLHRKITLNYGISFLSYQNCLQLRFVSGFIPLLVRLKLFAVFISKQDRILIILLLMYRSIPTVIIAVIWNDNTEFNVCSLLILSRSSEKVIIIYCISHKIIVHFFHKIGNICHLKTQNASVNYDELIMFNSVKL